MRRQGTGVSAPGPGDRLRVVVFGQEGLSNLYIVDATGKISMPLIGTVSARGCTTAQLARVIADRLRNGFVREPHVAIEVELYRPFFILGEVIAPGLYPYVPNMTVETAVAIAGGFSPRAYRYDAELSRSQSGVTARQKVPLIAPVRPGDTVTIAERWFCRYPCPLPSHECSMRCERARGTITSAVSVARTRVPIVSRNSMESKCGA